MRKGHTAAVIEESNYCSRTTVFRGKERPISGLSLVDVANPGKSSTSSRRKGDLEWKRLSPGMKRFP
jgi:hypothetical protein